MFTFRNNKLKYFSNSLKGFLSLAYSFHVWKRCSKIIRNQFNSISPEYFISTKYDLVHVNLLVTYFFLNQGNLPMPYLKSVLGVYDIILRNPTSCSDMVANKVKQEIIHGLGNNLYDLGRPFAFVILFALYLIILLLPIATLKKK